MKTFKDYLVESKQTYDFKIKLAVPCDANLMTQFKELLEAFKLESISQPSRKPMQTHNEFPSYGPIEMTIIDVTLGYPATDAQVRNELVGSGVPAAAIVVVPANHPHEAMLAGKEFSNQDPESKQGQSVLLEPEMKVESVKPVDEVLPQDRMGSLIKEILAARNYEYPDAAGGKTPAAKPM